MITIRTDYCISIAFNSDRKRLDDNITNNSYRLDLHQQGKPGLTFKYPDGTEVYSSSGFPSEKKRWREETSTNPTFYQVPLRWLIPPLQ